MLVSKWLLCGAHNAPFKSNWLLSNKLLIFLRFSPTRRCRKWEFLRGLFLKGRPASERGNSNDGCGFPRLLAAEEGRVRSSCQPIATGGLPLPHMLVTKNKVGEATSKGEWTVAHFRSERVGTLDHLGSVGLLSFQSRQSIVAEDIPNEDSRSLCNKRNQEKERQNVHSAVTQNQEIGTADACR